MTEQEAILRIQDHIAVHSKKEPMARHITEAHVMAVKSLEEIQQYRAIGTVEKCREAMERQMMKQPIILNEQIGQAEGLLYVAKKFQCPTCKNTTIYVGGLPNNCDHCGQRLATEEQHFLQ